MSKHNLKRFNGGFNGLTITEYTAWVDSLITNDNARLTRSDLHNTIIAMTGVLGNRQSGLETLTGTVSVTNGTAAVVGVGTDFRTSFSANSKILIDGDEYIVQSMDGATTLTLTTNVTQEYVSVPFAKEQFNFNVIDNQVVIGTNEKDALSGDGLFVQGNVKINGTLKTEGSFFHTGNVTVFLDGGASFFNSGFQSVLRIDSENTRVGVGTATPSTRLEVAVGNISMSQPTVPASAAATGYVGEIAWDADYIYVCTATDTWKRTAIATW